MARVFVNDSIELESIQRFGSGVGERFELRFEALLLKPIVGTIASFNAVHLLNV